MSAQLVDRSPPGELGRIKWIDEDGCFLYIELAVGRFAWLRFDAPTEFAVDDHVLVSENSVVRAPDDLWPDETWVAVVKRKLDDLTVVDASGHLRVIPTNEVTYEVGNTVLATVAGVERKLDDQPLRIWDTGSLDEAALAPYKRPAGSGNLSFADFGGLKEVVERAQELVEVQLRHHDRLKAINARPIKGVLFTGGPGSGKTMLARIIAKEVQATLYLIRGPEFVSKWVGKASRFCA